MGCNCSTYFKNGFLVPFFWSTFHQQWYPQFQHWFQANDIINTRIHASVTLKFYLKNGFNNNEYFFQFYLWRYSVKNTLGVDVNNAWPLTFKASSVLKNRITSLDFGIWLYVVGGTESVYGFPTEYTKQSDKELSTLLNDKIFVPPRDFINVLIE